LALEASDTRPLASGRSFVVPIRCVTRLLCLLIAAVAALVVAAPASAKSGACPEREFSKVFSAFGDNALYTLAPDGAFEAGAAGWELGEGAAVVAESSSIQLGDALGAQSLELADGASATTPEICVERGFPSFRFVRRAVGESRTAVRMQVLYGAGRKAKKAGRVRARGEWAVSRKVALA
jgi:hypothetical protein